MDGIPENELREIERDHACGRFSMLETALERYMSGRGATVLLFHQQMQTTAPDATLDAAVCAYLLSSNTLIPNKALTPQQDMEDQREEIKREYWYQGEKGNHDHAAIASDWITKYGAGWRKHRMRTLLWLYQQRREHYLSLLTAPRQAAL